MNRPLQSNNDLIMVRLSAVGVEAAKGAPLSVHGASVKLDFVGDTPIAVHRAVWTEALKTTAPFGKPWFEIVADPAVPVAAAETEHQVETAQEVEHQPA